MIFKSLQNIESSFKMTKLIALVAIVASALVSVYVVTTSQNTVKREREKIYVLDKGKSLILALSQDMAQNRPVEARSHVQLFHELFFTLSPDNEAINHNIRRALFLADESAYNYHKDLVEAGYYRRIISTNITQRIIVDSVMCDLNEYPYNATTYARQIISRASNITTRHLITSCQLTNEVRSDNNPHGFKIINLIVEKNNDLGTQKRR